MVMEALGFSGNDKKRAAHRAAKDLEQSSHENEEEKRIDSNAEHQETTTWIASSDSKSQRATEPLPQSSDKSKQLTIAEGTSDESWQRALTQSLARVGEHTHFFPRLVGDSESFEASDSLRQPAFICRSVQILKQKLWLLSLVRESFWLGLKLC